MKTVNPIPVIRSRSAIVIRVMTGFRYYFDFAGDLHNLAILWGIGTTGADAYRSAYGLCSKSLIRSFMYIWIMKVMLQIFVIPGIVL